MANILRRKPLGVILAEAHDAGEHSLKRSLGAWSLTALGVGAVIGAGIFVMSGLGAQYAGPGLMISFIVSGLGCAFAALCYAEFAAMIPLAGSAYTYAYATLGELFAWIIGWDLTLEYAMGASTVSSGWSNNFVEFLRIFHLRLPLWLCYDHWTALGVAKDFVAREMVSKMHPELALGSQGYLKALDLLKSAPPESLTEQAHAYLNAPHFFGHEFGLNLPAFFIAMVISYILAIGIKESARFNAGIVVIKVAIVLFVIFMGIKFISPANWGHDWTSFAPNGISGIWTAASYVFFAYIGFDAVSTTAQEAKNPQRDLPIGIIASLGVCTLLYVAVAAVLTGMVPWHAINIEAPLSHAFADRNLGWAANIVTCGALAGLTSVMLVMLLGQTRVLFSMASDGLLPRKLFGEVHPKYKTPFKNTILVGLLAAIVGSLTPIDDIGKMVNIGTLLAFVIVCIAITIMRFTEPDQPRPFRTPGIYFSGRLPIVPLLGVFFNGYMMYKLGTINWIRLVVWLIIGLFVYFLYSVKHSKVQALPEGTR